MKSKSNVGMIEVVAKGLGPLKERAIFVGGATVALYVKDTSSMAVRPTDDVDCVVEITSRQNYYDLQAALEKAGFRHSKDEKAPICRMDFAGLKVDIMPSDPRILGFSNIWYRRGQRDFRLSSDFEDIVTVLAGQKDFDALLSAPEAVRTYLKKHFRTFVGDPVFIEALSAHLDPGPDRREKAELLLDRINGFCVEG